MPAAFCLAILSGLFVPIYSDEIGWRLQERAGLDGVDKLFSLLCGPTSVARPPLWMMPARAYSAFWNVQFAAPLFTRLSGLIYALVWGTLVAVLIGRLTREPERRRILVTLSAAMMTVGIMPWLMIWSRPEQPILLSLTASILVSSGAWRVSGGEGARSAWSRAVAIVLLAAVALSYHLKAVFLFPVFAACIATSSRGGRSLAPRLTAGALLAALTAHGAQYWIARLRCPADQGFLQSQNLGSDLLASRSLVEAGAVLLRMIGNINPFPYLGRTAPRPDVMSSWLAQSQVSQGTTTLWWVAITFLWCLAFLFAGDTLVRQAKSKPRGLFDPRMIVVEALLVSIVGWIATQVMQNDYEAALVVPMMLLVVVIALSCKAASAELFASVRALALAASLGALVSMVLVASTYAPSLASAARQQGYLALQPYSIGVFGYEPLRKRILDLAATCGIPAQGSRNLVLDDVTYYPFMTSRTPDHAGGRFGPGRAWELTADYLRARRSDGVVATCGKLPAALQSRARRDGELCCVAPYWN